MNQKRRTWSILEDELDKMSEQIIKILQPFLRFPSLSCS